MKAEDTKTIQSATEVLSGRSKKGRLSRLLPFLGPAFIASVAYVDPGNFATNIQEQCLDPEKPPQRCRRGRNLMLTSTNAYCQRSSRPRIGRTR